MNLAEEQIEELIYNNPWLIDERFSIPQIKGAKGQKGRQINLGKGKSRFVDLLFKDDRDNRPVIIELKKNYLTRDNIAQILEYRALLLSLEDNLKDEWINEFGCNYYIPKLILIGVGADEEIIISANLAGIDLRFLGDGSIEEIGFNSFEHLQTKISEWSAFRSSGNRSLTERVEWVKSIIDFVLEVVNKYTPANGKPLQTITKIPKLPISFSNYIDYEFPFLNIPIIYNQVCILGIYEYFNIDTPFDDKFFYISFEYLHHYNPENNLSQKAYKKVRDFKLEYIEVFDYEEQKGKSTFPVPSFKIHRAILEDKGKFLIVLHNLISLSLEIYDETYQD